MSRTELSREAREFLERQRVGHLATADRAGNPHVVPVCYAWRAPHVYFVCDEKPKRGSPRALKRLANLRENPRAALVVDHYEDDWSQLAYLLLQLDAATVDDTTEYEAILDQLRGRYPGYRAMDLRIERNPMVRLTPTSAHFWQSR